MSRGASVIVAGAGALGLSAALALADAGCAVTVCDRLAEPQASAVAAGMLAPVFEVVLDGGGETDLELLLAARNLWPGLAVRAGVAIDRSGTAAVGSEAWLAEVRSRLLGFGLRGADLPRAMLDELFPGAAPGLQALLLREDWRLEPRAALAALRAAAQVAGVQFRAETVRERGRADWLVAATGAAHSLAPELSRLTPIKGQILRYPGVRGGAVSLRAQGAYAVPGEGGLALGATMEAGRADTAIDPARAAPLIRAGEALLPGLTGAACEISAAVRAATPDGLPMVGVSRDAGVIVAAGARRNGWLLAPLVAQVVAAYVTGRDPGPYATRLDPARFALGETA